MERLDNSGEQSNRVQITAAQTAVLMAILTLGSKLLGFVREMVMAGFFGTSYIVDAYVMSQSIPSIIFAGIFGAVATSYMPLLSDKIEKGSEKEGNIFTSQVLNILFVASAISAIIGLIFSDQLTALLAKGFTGETAELTSFFLKITFAYVIFSSTSGILEAYLQYKNTFLPQIIIGYSQNIIVIATIIISAYFSYYYLALGLLVAYAIRLLLMFMMAKRRGYKYHIHGEKTAELIKSMAALAIPVFIGSGVSQINLFVDKYLASGLVEGSVSALNYANILNMMVMTLSISILNTMIYPRLTQACASGNKERFNQLIQKGFNIIIIISVPFSLGAMVYNNQIVQTVFERGAFDVAATSLTGSAYLYYSAGMVFMALNTLFVQTYYSMHDMKTPMIFAVIGVVINIVLNVTLVGSMQHNGLALATSIAVSCNTILLYVGLKRKYRQIKIIKDKKKIAMMIMLAAISVSVSYVVYALLTDMIWMPRLIYLGLAVLTAIIVYLLLMVFFKIDEIGILQKLLKGNRKKCI